MDRAKVLKVEGLTISIKGPDDQPDPNHPDTDLLEVNGLPMYGSDETLIQNYAEALLATVIRSEKVAPRRDVIVQKVST